MDTVDDTPVQTGHFLDAIQAERLYAYHHLLVFRGPRRGEGFGLRWPNLGLAGGSWTSPSRSSKQTRLEVTLTAPNDMATRTAVYRFQRQH